MYLVLKSTPHRMNILDRKNNSVLTVGLLFDSVLRSVHDAE